MFVREHTVEEPWAAAAGVSKVSKVGSVIRVPLDLRV
jgi:hypothetical protein